MDDHMKSLTLEDIANVRIKAYKNEPQLPNSEQEKKPEDNFYSVYILTYIKHIVRIKTNLALHGGLYSNYFEKYEEESISNIMLENLLSKTELNKRNNNNNNNNKKKGPENNFEEIKEENKRDLNYSIKELLKKLIKSYKIKENKIFLVTGMLGCGKTTCVSLAIEYFNKFLQIENNMNAKNDEKKVLFLSTDETLTDSNSKKSYKKTPYISKNYETNIKTLKFSQDEDSYNNGNNSSSTSTSTSKLKINSNEPLFNFTPKKKKRKANENDSENDTFKEYEKTNTQHSFSEKKKNPLSLNIEIINNNVKNIFQNNDLSPLRKNTNIRNKIQLEQSFKERSSDFEINSDSEDDEFSEKYKKIINEIKTEENEERFIYTVRINAYLYKDDLHCIKSILTQLCNYINKEEKFEAGMLLNDYILKLEKVLIQINKDEKHTLLIIENVEKFCLQNKQNLLYTLFDLMHKKNIFINIICLTNILDITQTLEKRIKSRFTFEMLHISPILDIEEISKLVYKILYVNLDDFHLIKKYYSVYFTYNDLVKIQKFLQIYNSTMQKEIANADLLKQWSYDINYGLDIRHIYHTCVDAILSICEYQKIFNTNQITFEANALLDPQHFSDSEDEEDEEHNSWGAAGGQNSFDKKNKSHFAAYIREYKEEAEAEAENETATNKKKKNNNKKKQRSKQENDEEHAQGKKGPVDSTTVMERLGFFAKETRNDMDFFKERQGKLAGTPMKMTDTNKCTNNTNDNENRDKNADTSKKGKDASEKKHMSHFPIEPIDMSPRKLKENLKNINENKNFFFQMSAVDMSPRKLKENLKQLNENKGLNSSTFNEFGGQEDINSPRKMNENINKTKIESQYILSNVQSKFIRRHYIKKVLRDLSTIEYMILCAFARLYKKNILPKTLYIIILEINKFKQAYPQEQAIGFSHDAYRRSFFRLVDLDIIILSSYSLSHLNIKNFSNDLFGLHEPTKFPCYDIFLENIDTYNLNYNLIQWVKHNMEVMQ